MVLAGVDPIRRNTIPAEFQKESIQAILAGVDGMYGVEYGASFALWQGTIALLPQLDVCAYSSAGTFMARHIGPQMVSGDPAEPYGLNTVGLQRRGFSHETLTALKKAYRIIFRKNLLVEEVMQVLEDMQLNHPEIRAMIELIRHSERGIARETRRNVVEAIDDID